MSIARKINVNDFKKRRKELLEEVGISMGQFKRRMFKVDAHGGADWKISDGKGANPSIRQQIFYLEQLLESSKDVIEEIKAERQKILDQQKQKESEGINEFNK